MTIAIAFKKYDTDGSGKIDAEELTNLCSELGAPLSPEEMSDAMAALDADNSGSIDKDEFTAWFEGRNTVSSKLRAVAKRARLENYVDIHVACWQGATEVVAEFLANDKTLARAVDDSDCGGAYLPLHYAAYAGHLKVCEMLLKAGADLNALNSAGVSAVFLAIQQDCLEVARFLIRSCARLDCVDNQHNLCVLDVCFSPEMDELVQSVLDCEHLAPPPALVEVSCEKHGELNVSWQPVSRKNERSLPVSAFQVKVFAEDSPDEPLCEKTVNGNCTSATVTFTSQDRALVARVAARSRRGIGEDSTPSNPCFVAAVPDPPAKVQCKPLRNALKVTWEVPKSRGSKIRKFEVYTMRKPEQKGDIQQWVKRASPKHNASSVRRSVELTIEGLHPSTEYKVKVLGVNGRGKSKSGVSKFVKTIGPTIRPKIRS